LGAVLGRHTSTAGAPVARPSPPSQRGNRSRSASSRAAVSTRITTLLGPALEHQPNGADASATILNHAEQVAQSTASAWPSRARGRGHDRVLPAGPHPPATPADPV